MSRGPRTLGSVYKEQSAERRTAWRAERWVTLPDGTKRRVVARGNTEAEAIRKRTQKEHALARAHPAKRGLRSITMTDTKRPTGTPFVGFRASDLQDALEARQRDPDGQLGLTAKRDLDRYYGALRRELKLAAATLTRGEKLALCDISNGTLWDSLSAGFLWAEVADTDAAQLAVWGVDQDALVAKLRALTPTQSLALVDALERWWLLPEVTDHDESLRAVGLA